MIGRGARGRIGPKRIQKEGPKSQILVVIYRKTLQEESNEQQEEHADFSSDFQGGAWKNDPRKAPKGGPEIADTSADLWKKGARRKQRTTIEKSRFQS